MARPTWTLVARTVAAFRVWLDLVIGEESEGDTGPLLVG